MRNLHFETNVRTHRTSIDVRRISVWTFKLSLRTRWRRACVTCVTLSPRGRRTRKEYMVVFVFSYIHTPTIATPSRWVTEESWRRTHANTLLMTSRGEGLNRLPDDISDSTDTFPIDSGRRTPIINLPFHRGRVVEIETRRLRFGSGVVIHASTTPDDIEIADDTDPVNCIRNE